jgi:ATP phosphoribosyltransferase regulatory subunit
LRELLDSFDIHPEHSDMLQALVQLNGDNALETADGLLRAADQPVKDALNYLREMADQITRWLPDTPIHFDLAELRGYHFHTGVVFAAFVPESGKEIARGGRYDQIGQVFGRARPATGFSADLKTLMLLGSGEQAKLSPLIYAPWDSDPRLQQRIEQLRAEGRRVVCALPGQSGGAGEMDCEEQLLLSGGNWELGPVAAREC